MMESIVGILADVLGIAGVGIQLIKIIRTHDATGVSYGLSVLLGASISFWMYYGITINDPVIYGTNTILAVILIGMFIFKMYCERKIGRRRQMMNDEKVTSILQQIQDKKSELEKWQDAQKDAQSQTELIRDELLAKYKELEMILQK